MRGRALLVFLFLYHLRTPGLKARVARGAAQGPKHFKQYLEDRKAKESELLELAGLYPDEVCALLAETVSNAEVGNDTAPK